MNRLGEEKGNGRAPGPRIDQPAGTGGGGGDAVQPQPVPAAHDAVPPLPLPPAPRRRLMVVGRKGCGKSTLINMVANLYAGKGYREDRVLAVPMRIEGKEERRLLLCNVEKWKGKYTDGYSVCGNDGSTIRWNEYRFKTPYYCLTLIDTPATLTQADLEQIGPVDGVIYVHRADDNKLVEEYYGCIDGQKRVYTAITHTVEDRHRVTDQLEISGIPTDRCFSFDNQCMIPCDKLGNVSEDYKKKMEEMWKKNTERFQEFIEDVYELEGGFIAEKKDEIVNFIQEEERKEAESREKAKLEAKRIEDERKKAELKMQEERYREEQRLQEVRRREQETREEGERQDRLAREEARAKNDAAKKKNQGQEIDPTNGNNTHPSPLPNNPQNFDQTVLHTPRSVISEIVVTLADESILSQFHLSILEKSRINLENMGRVIMGVKRDNTVRDGMDRKYMDIVKIEVPDEIKRHSIPFNFPTSTKSPCSHPNIICMACKTTCIATPLMKKEDLTDPNFLTKHNTFDKYLDCTKCQHDVSMHICTPNEYTASIKEIKEREYEVEKRAHTYVIRENKNANRKKEDIDYVINNMQKWKEWADKWIENINADIAKNNEEIQRCSDRISNNLSMIVYLCTFIPSFSSSNGYKYDYFENYIRKCKIEGEKEYPCRKELIEAYIQKKSALHNLPSSQIHSSMLIQANIDFLLDTIIRIQQDLQAQLAKFQDPSHPSY